MKLLQVDITVTEKSRLIASKALLGISTLFLLSRKFYYLKIYGINLQSSQDIEKLELELKTGNAIVTLLVAFLFDLILSLSKIY